MAYKSFEDILNDVYDSTNKALKIKVTALDDQPINLGTGGTVKLLYETADANANELILVFPEGGATDVPVFVIGDASIDNVDLGWFNGITEPTIVVVNDAADAYVSLDAGDDAVAGSKGLYFKSAADEDVELLNMSLTGTPRIYWDESEDQFRSTKGWVFDAACDVQGTWVATAAWTLPAITLGGAITGTSQNINSIAGIGVKTNASSDTLITGWFNDTITNGATRTGYAADMDLDYTTAAATGRSVALEGSMMAMSANTQNWTADPFGAVGVRANIGTQTGGSGTITGMAAFVAAIQGIGAGAADIVVTNLYTGLYIPQTSLFANSRVTNDYGIYISNQLGGATSNWGIYSIDNNCYFGAGYLQVKEMTAPGAGAADTVRIYAVIDGGSLTDLAAVFQDGTVDIFAQEVTEPGAPIYQFPDNTELKLRMLKPDNKTIQFVATFPDGRDFVMREYRYPKPRW